MKNTDPPNSVELLCDCGAKQAVAAPTRYKKCLRCSGRNGFVIPISRKDCGATLGLGSIKRCNHYRQIVACMLSGVSRVHPVIAGCSTAPGNQPVRAPRPPTIILDASLPHCLGH